MEQKRKNSLREHRQRLVCVFTDWITTFVAFFCFDVFRFFYMGIGDTVGELVIYLLSVKLILEQVFVPLALLLVYWLSGYYNRPFERSRLNELLVTFYSQIFNSILIYLAALTNDQLYLRRENWMLLLILFLLLFTFTYIGRLIVTDGMMNREKKEDNGARTVIVGLSDEAEKVAKRLSTPTPNKPGAKIVAFMPFGNEKENDEFDFMNAERLDSIDELKNLCEQSMVDEVILVPPVGKSHTKKILFFLYSLYPHDVSIKVNPDILSIITPAVRLEDILGEPFIDLSRPRISEFSKNVKRTIDVFASVLGMLVLAPVFIAAAAGVKMSGPGKILYSQERVGLHRKPFRIWKFRSMVPEAEADGVPHLSSDGDTRITPFGKWMRKFRIDELPQFWNVLKGDMSLVGPRPEREYYIERIVRKAPWYTLVLQVRPGITSWGMVKYGYAVDVDQMIERNRYDLIYIANMSVAVDFKILIHTIKTVGAGEGK